MKVEATGAADYPAEAVARIGRVLDWIPGAQMFLVMAMALQMAGVMAFTFLVAQPVWGQDVPFWVDAGGFVVLLLAGLPAVAATFAGTVEDRLTAVRRAATAVWYSPAAGGDVTVDLPGED